MIEELAKSGDPNECEQAAGALRNLAANHAANKDAIREAGGIVSLVGMLRAGVSVIGAERCVGVPIIFLHDGIGMSYATITLHT